MEFRVLGPLEVLQEGRSLPLGGPKQRAVLAHLLLRSNHVVPTETLIDALWGEEPPDTARNTLQRYVSHLRGALGDGRIEGRSPGYVLHADADEVDSLRFDALVRQARDVLADDPSRASELLATALGLWNGPAIADLAEEPSVSGEAIRLEESRLMALEDRIAADLALGRHAELVGELEALTREQPLRERLWEQLMLALYRSGRQADALRAFQRFRSVLAEELGLDPSPQLGRLQERILLHDPALGVEAPDGPAASTRNPFKGLLPFGEPDADDFFGREALVRRLLEALRRGTRLLSLVGPSGCGKSSVVHAGLIPALRSGAIAGSEGWLIARMVPGRHPFEELRAARRGLAPPDAREREAQGLPAPVAVEGRSIEPIAGARLLIVVDQFEELFSVSDEHDREDFLEALAAAVSEAGDRVSVVVTLRADFYDRPLKHPAFAEVFAAGVVTVVPMSPVEIEEAVVAPARAVGVNVESALLAELVADTTNQAGALPLLQYAMTELFDGRAGASVTLAEYHALGGLRGALSRRAEGLYERLDEPRQRVALQVFLRLVRLGRGTGDSARRVSISELTALDLDPVDLSEVLEAFGGHRLLSFDRDPATGAATVQVAHEALLTAWERLAGWVKHHRSDLERHESFLRALGEWEGASHDPDYLLTGSRLAEADAWSRESSLQLTQEERDYLEAGLERRRRQEKEEAASRERQRGLERRARTRLVALVAASALLVGSVWYGTSTWLGSRPADAALVFVGTGSAPIPDRIAAGFDRAVAELDVRAQTVATNETQYPIQYRRLAEEGVGLVVATDGSCGDSLSQVAADHPDTRYLVLDCLGELPDNVSTVWFASEEGSFLAGAAAASKSRTGIVGFIGGVDVPLVWAFEAGFEAGARYVDPTIEVRSTYLTSWPDLSGFSSTTLASLAAKRMYGDGADVIYHAAGYAGFGVFEAAASGSAAQGRHLWAIGVDDDQFMSVADYQFDPASLKPHILTSVVKRYGPVVHDGVVDFFGRTLAPGLTVVGLAEGGVDIAYSGGFIDDIRPTIEEIKAKIIAGDIEVPSIPPDKEDEVSEWPSELLPP